MSNSPTGSFPRLKKGSTLIAKAVEGDHVVQLEVDQIATDGRPHAIMRSRTGMPISWDWWTIAPEGFPYICPSGSRKVYQVIDIFNPRTELGSVRRIA